MIPTEEISFKSLGIVSLEGKADPEELFEVFWTDSEAYDALRSSLITVSAKGGGVPHGVPSVNNHQAESSDGSATTGIGHSNHWRVLSILAGRVVLSISESWSVPILKTAVVFVAYLMISAGIVVSRTDTRKTTVREGPVATTKEAMDAAKTETGKSSFAQAAIAPAGSEDTISVSAYALQPIASATASELKLDKAQIPEPAAKPALPEIVSDIKPAPVDQRSKWMTLIETVPIPAGIFNMGNETGKGDEKPQHQVRLDGFNMSRTEITNRQYFAFLEDTGYQRPRDPDFMKNYLLDAPDLPVVNVSYADAVAFCAWASTRFNATIGLPTEAQWEYAAVAGKNVGPFPWGAKARFKANAPQGVKTVAGNAFPANRFGLYNMIGNVSEWVLDYYSKDYYATSPIRNPTGPISGTRRSIRGGSWADDEAALWATRRSSHIPSDLSDEIGFRIVASDSRHPTPANSGQQPSRLVGALK